MIVNSLSLLIGSVTLYFDVRDHLSWYILPFLIIDLLQFYFLLPILPGRAPLLKIGARPSDLIVALLSANFWILWNAMTIALQNLSIYPDWALVTDIGFIVYGLGFFLSTWGILTLRLSFSVLPEKRKIIHTGPYRYVPHPIYLGYALMTLGQSLSTGFITLWIGTLLYSLLFMWRASKEDKILYS